MGSADTVLGVPSAPRVTVVVATHGRPHLLRECLAAIAVAARPGDEVIVMESGPSGARDAVGVPAALVRSERREKSAKLNQAARIARGDVLLLTDDDCRVEPGWVEGMASAFDDARVGAAFGPVRGLSSPRAGAEPVGLPPGPGPQELWAYAHGASMAVRREALFDAGGFDERFGPGAPVSGGEEGDLVLRMRERGWVAAVADAPTVTHVEWRTRAQDDANVMVYVRSAGAYLGAGLRRSPRTTVKVLLLRLLFEKAQWHEAGRRASDALSTARAFAGGLWQGLRLPPRRFL
jgi:GT2 family glycosyltransferase